MISELQDGSVGNMQIKTEVKKENNSEKSLRDTWEMVRDSNICVFGPTLPQRREIMKKIKYLKYLWPSNFQNWWKT